MIWSLQLAEHHGVKNRNNIFREIYSERKAGLELSLMESPDTLSACTVLFIHWGDETLVLLVCLPGEGKGAQERSSDGCVGC